MQTQIDKVDMSRQLTQVKTLADLKDYPKILNYVFESVMQKEVDYGDPFPGAPKPSLWKPGAELLATFFHVIPADPIFETKIENLEKPFFAYTVKQRFYDERSDILRGTGVGSANTGETRYAFRRVSDKYYEAMKPDEKSACFQKWNEKYGKLEWFRRCNEDEVLTQANTVLKMGVKRAYVDGILKITGADRIFTQDVEDYEEAPPERNVTPPKASEERTKAGSVQGKQILSGLEGKLN